MTARDLAVIRTKLREINVEYSALVRAKSGEGRFVRMGQIRAERRALVSLIARNSAPRESFRASARSGRSGHVLVTSA